MKTVLIASGKGGTGKTTTTAMIGRVMAEKLAYRVALLDLDVTGPNLAHAVGVEPYGALFDENNFFPKAEIVTSGGAIEVFSPSFLIPPDVACAWSGDRRMELIHELLEKVKWNDPHIMICDCPPGTGDEIISVMKYAPEVAGAVVVTTGKNESLVDARRLISLMHSERFNIPVLGIIMSMSFIAKGEEIFPLFDDGIDFEKELGVPVIGIVPWRQDRVLNDYFQPTLSILKSIGMIREDPVPEPEQAAGGDDE